MVKLDQEVDFMMEHQIQKKKIAVNLEKMY